MAHKSIILNILKAPLAAIFHIIVYIRHCLFDWNILRQHEFPIPVICVGNLAVGGTGKTPHALLLLQMLADHNIKVALLSRGYKRTSKGFRYVEASDSADMAGDEPLLIKHRHPQTVVAVCADRVHGINRLCSEHPDLKAIVLDDALQHRHVKPGLSIVLTAYNNLASHDYMMPLGRLRDLKSRLQHAEIIMVSKCPPTLKPIDFNLLAKETKIRPYQHLFFTSYRYSELQPMRANPTLVPTPKAPIIALAGVAHPEPFFEHLQKGFRLAQTLMFADHHRFDKHDVAHLEKLHRDYPNCPFVTTEKDAVRLATSGLSEALMSCFYYVPIDVEFLNNGLENFTNNFISYVRKNKRIGRLY